MSIELKKGVNLVVLPTKKYKTCRIFIRFTAKHTAIEAAKRTLLTSLLETSSSLYKTQTQVSRQLARLYGAGFGINVNKKGNLHHMNVAMTIVNGKYVEDPQIFNSAFSFLKEILFHPNIQDGFFEKNTFLLEKNNLLSYMKSVEEDKQSFASLSLQDTYFTDSDQQAPSFGRIEDVESLTAEALVETYQKMITEDQVDIFVIGDVTEAEVLEAANQLPFSEGKRSRPEIFYQQKVENSVRQRELFEPVTQAKLNLGYHTGVYYGQQERFALIIFNGLFGGFPHSKLFMNVREKESLAYYASSNVDTFRGYLSVQTGIDGVHRKKVLQLIEEQLASLQRGEVTEAELAQTKAMLKNQYLLSLDNPQAQIETAYLDQWLPTASLSEAQFMEKIDQVTLSEVQDIAKKIQLQAIFFLDKESQND